ncbi:ATP-grasp domain-containing protein [Flavobacterium silvisoli]|uniref:ATP-grasp domain-containing protein n=1 Tax=Flavobacterium silvisoli TaxID=2529433 RepID=A0A4Q9Z4L3_9FLAO|nr:ATP-grasp domain-containing protein [Flavobacterium silvisoli]TBX71222.1 ATP-grasp domain-containing protein [Flavobacterium silvisoli]
MKKLAIIGASYLQLPLVLKAKEMGLETHCFAWPDGAVCKEASDYFYPISILEKETILEQCKKIGIDAITTIATDMAVPTICYVAKELGLIANSYESAIISTNKSAMRQAFVKGNCNIPKFRKVDSEVFNIDDFTFPVIIKPVDRSGSRAIFKAESSEEIPAALATAIDESFAKNAIIEEFIEGVEVSVETISWKGEHTILAITDKTTTNAPYFVELAHHQPSKLPEQIQKRIKEETIKCLNALHIQYGAGHSEFKITDKGEVFVIEVGARMGGDFIGSHLVELSTGYDFLKGVIQCALNEFKKPYVQIKNNAGVFFLCEETRELLPYFNKKNTFDIEKKIFEQNLKSIHNSNDRSGYLIYQSNERIELL